jgi:DUF971 family protein
VNVVCAAEVRFLQLDTRVVAKPLHLVGSRQREQTRLDQNAPVRLLMDLIRVFSPCLRIRSHRPSCETPSLTHPLVEDHPDEQRVVVVGKQGVGLGIASEPEGLIGHAGYSA